MFWPLLFLFVPGFGQENPLYSEWMAESVIQRNPGIYRDWDYETGTLLRGFQSLWELTGEEKYFNYIRNTVDNALSENGMILNYDPTSYNIDEIKEGSIVLFLFEQTGEEKYRIAAEQLRQQLEDHPRTTEGGFWHKLRYPHQMWLDGLYMGSPFLAQFGKLFDRPQDMDDAIRQITLMDKHAYDPQTGLYFHGWDESKTQDWADPVSGCSPSFWGRAIGWYAMAIVDVLDYVPEHHPDRPGVLEILQRLAEGVSQWQDETSGLWYQVVDKKDSTGNYAESSVSAMLCYTLAKAVRKGYIERQAFLPVAQHAWQGIIDEFVSVNAGDQTINLDKTCATAGLGYGRDGSYEYYVYETYTRSNDAKAIGPFISAALEMENPLYPPSLLQVDSLSSDRVSLSWKDNTAGETGFILRRYHSIPGDTLIYLSANTHSYTDFDLQQYSIYRYEIRTIRDLDTSAFTPALWISTPGTDLSPGLAFHPVPPEKAENIPVSVALSWTPGGLTTEHKVYFGTMNPPPLATQTQDARFDPGLLNHETRYYWRVDEVNGSGLTTGPVWLFTTVRPPEERVAHWTFDSPDYHVLIDSSSYQHHGVLHNFFESNLTDGIKNSGLVFNGSDQFAYVPEAEALHFGAGSFSISLWIRMDPENIDVTKQSRFLIKGSHIKKESLNNSGKRYELFHHAYSGEIRFSIDDDVTKSVGVIPDEWVITGEWVHLVAVRDAQQKTLKWYVNGDWKTSAPDHTGNISQDEPLYLGFAEDYPQYLEGAMDEISLYARALTDEEIKGLFDRYAMSSSVGGFSDKAKWEWALYPNPFDQSVRFYSNSDFSQDIRLEITDLNGRLRGITQPEKSALHHGSLLDLTSLEPGVYFIKVIRPGDCQIRRIVKK